MGLSKFRNRIWIIVLIEGKTYYGKSFYLRGSDAVMSYSSYFGNSKTCISGFSSRSGKYLDGLSVFGHTEYFPVLEYLKGSWQLLRSYLPTHTQ